MKNSLKIWAVALLLAFVVPVFAVADANAKPTMGMGTVTLVSSKTVRTEVLSDHTTLLVRNVTFRVTGALTGMAVGQERDVIHNVTGRHIIMTTFHGSAKFTGTLGGMSGTLTIRYEGRSNSTIVRGHFSATDGTAQLDGVHASGSFEGPSTSATLNYSIRWFAAHHHEVEDETSDIED